jgi:uncharacterized BrkB/YihY/UPF0761 family membrane protein
MSERHQRDYCNSGLKMGLKHHFFGLTFSFVIPLLFAIFINTFSKCCVGMRKRTKLVNYRMETCRRVKRIIVVMMIIITIMTLIFRYLLSVRTDATVSVEILVI